MEGQLRTTKIPFGEVVVGALKKQDIKPAEVEKSIPDYWMTSWLAVQAERVVYNATNAVPPPRRDLPVADNAVSNLFPRTGLEDYLLGVRRFDRVLSPQERIISVLEVVSSVLDDFTREDRDMMKRTTKVVLEGVTPVGLTPLFFADRIQYGIVTRLKTSLDSSKIAVAYNYETHRFISPYIGTLEYKFPSGAEPIQSYTLPDRREPVIGDFIPIIFPRAEIPPRLREAASWAEIGGMTGDPFFRTALDYLGHRGRHHTDDRWIFGQNLEWAAQFVEPPPPHNYKPDRLRGRMLRKRIWGDR